MKEQQAYANIALANALRQNNFSDQDRRFITELVYGVTKAGDTLDWLLENYMNRPMHKITPAIQAILRLGAYQIRFMSKIPASAACNQSVDLAKKYGHAGTVKFVNAVLRAMVRQPDKAVYPNKSQQLEAYLALKYWHPQWMVKRWIQMIGAEAAEQLCAMNNETPLLSLRTNTLKCSPDLLYQKLSAEKVEIMPSVWAPEGYLCKSHPALDQWDALRQGLFQIQDESSMLAAHVVSPQPGEFIIDACSAPGGKTTHMAALMKNEGRILALDLHEHKLDKIKENARRLGIQNIETKCMDALQIGTHFKEMADRVLIDAPCSGLGVLRRKPDARWRKQESMIAELSALQFKILSSGAKAVKNGGILVYSTCTIDPEENSQVIEKFLSLHPNFKLDCASDLLPLKKKQGKMLQFWPHEDGIDGFFIARLIRKG